MLAKQDTLLPFTVGKHNVWGKGSIVFPGVHVTPRMFNLQQEILKVAIIQTGEEKK